MTKIGGETQKAFIFAQSVSSLPQFDFFFLLEVIFRIEEALKV